MCVFRGDVKLHREVHHSGPLISGMPEWLGGDNHLREAVPCVYQLVTMVKTDAPEIGTRAQGEIRECVAKIVHAGTQA